MGIRGRRGSLAEDVFVPLDQSWGAECGWSAGDWHDGLRFFVVGQGLSVVFAVAPSYGEGDACMLMILTASPGGGADVA